MHEIYLIFNLAAFAAVIYITIEHSKLKENLDEMLQEHYILKKDLKLLSEKCRSIK